jgi:hypothetical protein
MYSRRAAKTTLRRDATEGHWRLLGRKFHCTSEAVMRRGSRCREAAQDIERLLEYVTIQ